MKIITIRKGIAIIHVIATIILIVLSIVKFNDEGRGVGYYLIYILPLCSLMLSYLAYVTAKWWLITVAFIAVIIIYTIIVNAFDVMLLMWSAIYILINIFFSHNIRRLQLVK